MKKNKKRLGVSVVIPITPLGKVLLGRRKEDGRWTTPAGGADPGETPVECAIREAYEEAVLEIVPNQLELIDTQKTPLGKVVSIFLFRSAEVYTSPNLDPDCEVDEWVWLYKEDFPDDFYNKKNDVRRPGILRALDYFNRLNKGEDISVEAKNKILDFVQRIRSDNPTLAEEIYTKIYPHGKQADESVLPEVKKSVVQMAHHSDGGDLRTEAAAVEVAHSDPKLLGMLRDGMADFEYGNLPVEFSLDFGTLFLVKIDEGLFSGYFEKVTPAEGGDLVDTAKVRIEKQTLATLTHFLEAKNWWIREEAEVEVSGKNYSDLSQKIKILELLDRMTS